MSLTPEGDFGESPAARHGLREAQAAFGHAVGLVHEMEATLGVALASLAEASRLLDDATTARRFLDHAVGLARASGHKSRLADVLSARGDLARDEHDDRRAAALHSQALRLYGQIADAQGVAHELEALSGVCARAGDPERAVRLVGAAQSLGEAADRPEPRRRRRPREPDVEAARRSLPADRLEAALAEGTAMSMADAVAYAATTRGAWREHLPTGWAGLTQAEREVAELAGQGLTNAEIGERLFVSTNTVKTHLARVFAKLGISSRRELARPGSGPR